MQTPGFAVAALAAEFGLTVDDTRDMCDMFGVDLLDEHSSVDAEGAALLRGIVSGALDPAEILDASEPAGTGEAPPVDDTTAEIDPVDEAPAPATVASPPERGPAVPSIPALSVEPLVATPPPAQALVPGAAEVVEAVAAAPSRPPRRLAGEDLPEMHRTSWWDRHLGGQRFDRYVPRWLRSVYLVSVVVVVVVIWWVLSSLGGAEEARSDALFAVAPGIEVGVCFDADPGLWLDSARVVSCAGPHDAQAAAVIELTPPGRAYPQLDDLRSEATVLCVDHLRSQFALEEGERVAASVPTAAEWRTGDQRVLCNVVHATGDKLVGPSF